MSILGLFLLCISPAAHIFDPATDKKALALFIFCYLVIFLLFFRSDRLKPKPGPGVAPSDAREPPAFPLEKQKLFPQPVPRRVPCCTSTFLSAFPSFLLLSSSVVAPFPRTLFVLLTLHLLLLLVAASVFFVGPAL